jgi:hypothetical protein
MKSLLIFLFSFLSLTSLACECPPSEPLSKEIADKFDVIFYGRIDSIKPCSSDGIGTAYFTIINLYKGAAEQHVAVDYDCTSECLMSLAKDESWIIYAVYQKFDLLTVSLCSPSRKKFTGGETDHYQVISQKSFDEENDFLQQSFGIKAFSSHNELNDKQREMQPHNEQPSAWGKLWLLLVSLAVLAIFFIVIKKFFKNDKQV